MRKIKTTQKVTVTVVDDTTLQVIDEHTRHHPDEKLRSFRGVFSPSIVAELVPISTV